MPPSPLPPSGQIVEPGASLAVTDDLHVIFGTGPLGLAVMRRLLASGGRVRLINRSGRAEAPPGVEMRAADATDPVAAGRVSQGASVVFHCATGPYGRWAETLLPLMAGIIAAAGAVGARLVYGDNLYMYGPVAGPLTENLPYRPIGPNTRVRAQVSTLLMESHAKGTVRAAIGRASDFYGPDARQSKVGDGVFARALAGKPAQVLGDPDAPHTHTYIDDFASGLVTLAEHEEALGEVWHVPSAETVTTRRFIEMVFEQIGTPARFQKVPAVIIATLGMVIPALRAVNEVMYQSQRPFVVDHSKFARAFGASPTPHRTAIAQTLAWFRQHPT